MAQMGISLNEGEIRDLIKAKVARLTGENEKDLGVHVTCWNGRLSTCVTHLDWDKDIKFKEGEPK